MEKEFVPYELAVKLKELGFDEPCLAIYHLMDKEIDFVDQTCQGTKWALAPLWQQAFDWFSTNHGLFYLVEAVASCDLRCVLIQHPGRMYHEVVGTYDNYNDAYKACVEKLIEIASTSPRLITIIPPN